MPEDRNSVLKQEFLNLKKEVFLTMEDFDISNSTHLQNFLFFLHYPLFSFAESVIILCESGKTHAAGALLRTLYEVHINLAYYQTEKADARLALAAKASFKGKESGVRELRKLIQDYPNLESANPENLFNRTWLENAEKWAGEYKDLITSGNDLAEKAAEPKLREKAEMCDAESKNVEGGYYQRMYSVIYRQLSPPAHLNVEGIQYFVEKDDKTGKYVFSDGDNQDLYLHQAIEICVAYTKDLYDSNLIKEERTEPIKRLETLLNPKPPAG